MIKILPRVEFSLISESIFVYVCSRSVTEVHIVQVTCILSTPKALELSIFTPKWIDLSSEEMIYDATEP